MRNRPRVKRRHLIATAGLVLSLAPALAALQSVEEGTRALWDTTFQKKRPPGKKAAQRQYPSLPVAAAVKSESDALVGVTVWRLRRSLPADEAATRILVHENAGASEWTPERVDAAKPLAEGQRVRFSIESARSGYLYVIGREQYADGSRGEPYLMFPTLRIRGGNNRIAPGNTIEIPSSDDRPPFLRLKRSRPDHVGEMLIILVTPEPLAEIPIGREPPPVSAVQVAAWEKKWGAQVQGIDARAQAGQAYTSAEKAAATGQQPLTSDDPLPQTLYRVEAKPGDPLLVNLSLRMGK